MTSEPRAPRHSAHLFIPAVRAELAVKAASTAASAVIVDLEDSVPVTAKGDARTGLAALVETLRQAGKSVYVRVNNTDALLHDDVAAALEAGTHGIVLPKAETVAQLEQLDAQITDWEEERGVAVGSTELELQVETAAGLLVAPQLAAALPRTSAMMLGVEDFSTELGIDPDDQDADLQWAHGLVLLAASAAGIAPYGLIGAFSNYRDTAAYAAAARRSRAFGYVGAYCIHPSQVAIAVEAFTPGREQLEQARRIVEAYAAAESAGRSATSLDGTMIDRPIAERARRLLTRAALPTAPVTPPMKDRR